MLGHLSFLLSLLPSLLGLLLRGDGVLLGYQGFLTFLLRTLAHLVGRTFLLDGLLTLLIGDETLLVGNLLHLAADAPDDGRALLFQAQLRHLASQCEDFTMLGVPAYQGGSRRCRQRRPHDCYDDVSFVHFFLRTKTVMSSLCSAPSTKVATSALIASTISWLDIWDACASVASRRCSP